MIMAMGMIYTYVLCIYNGKHKVDSGLCEFSPSKPWSIQLYTAFILKQCSFSVIYNLQVLHEMLTQVKTHDRHFKSILEK